MSDHKLEPDGDVTGGEEDEAESNVDGNGNLAGSDDFDSEDEGN